MRQAGLLAAAALFALEHNFERLAEDHQRAGRLAGALGALPRMATSSPETNIVMIDVPGSPSDVDGFMRNLAERGVLVSRFGPTRLRAVTHLGIDDAAVDRAVEAFRSVTAAI